MQNENPYNKWIWGALHCIYSLWVQTLSRLRQVGACIVNPENKIVGIGYNGMPNGCNDDLLPWSRAAEDRLDTKYPYGESERESKRERGRERCMGFLPLLHFPVPINHYKK